MQGSRNRRGVTVVLLVSLVLSLTLAGLYFAFAPKEEVVPAVASQVKTLADYVAVSAAEEALHQIASTCNRPGRSPSGLDWYALLRDPASGGKDLPMSCPLTIAQFERSTFRLGHAPFSGEGIRVKAIINFDDPFLADAPKEYGGILRLEVEVEARWGRGESLGHRLVRHQAFKVSGITTPKPYEGSPFVVLRPALWTEASTRKLFAECKAAGSLSRRKASEIAAGYDALSAACKKLLRWPCCQKAIQPLTTSSFALPPASSPATAADPSLPEDAVLVVPPGGPGTLDLADLDPRLRLETRWKKLRGVLTDLLELSTCNLEGARLSAALLATIPDGATRGTLGLSKALEGEVKGIHELLERLLAEQLRLGRASLLCLQRFAGEMIEGRPAPAGSHLDPIDGAAAILRRLEGDLSETLTTRLHIGAADMKDLQKNLAEGSELLGAKKEASLAQLVELAGKRGPIIQKELVKWQSVFEDLSKLRGKDEGLVSAIATLEGAFPPAGDKDGRGLIHGWFQSLLLQKLLLLPKASRAFESLRGHERRFQEGLWRKKAMFVVSSQKDFDACLAQFVKDCKGVNGVVFYENPVPLKLHLHLFQGRMALYSTSGFIVDRLTVREPKRDQVTLVTPGSIICNVDSVQASLCAIGNRKSVLRLPPGGKVQGKVILHRHPSPGEGEESGTALRGEIEYRSLGSARWVSLAPAGLSEEVNAFDAKGR